MRGAAVSLTGGFIVLLLTVPVVQGQSRWGATYSSTEICDVKGSTVVMSCSYRYPTRQDGVKTIVEKTLWFVKQSNGIYVDLRTDPDYTGRVQHHCDQNSCSLTITDLRERDSAKYKFRFETNQPGGTFTGEPGVTLSVAGLQVSRTVYTSSTYTVLRCQNSCDLPGRLSYIWYKNHQFSHEGSSLYSRYIDPNQKYSCAVKGHEGSRSPSVFVDWGVTYTSTEICALRGSTVEMNCTYRYPSRINSIVTKVNKRFWFTKLNPTGSAVDLDTDSNYNGRLEHVCNENICSLRIRHLRTTDSAQYKFRFETNQNGGSYSGSPGVTLSVADHQLQVNVRRSTVSQSNWTELTCHSSCPDGHFSYIWYKNGHKVEGEKNKYFLLHSSGSADSYHCAIVGNEDFSSPQVYAPKLLPVSLSPSGDIKEGVTVTLTCSSDANPAAKYTWYKNQTRLSTEPQFVFRSIQSSDSGQYHCAAENDLGRTTANLFIDVKYAPKLPSVSVSPSGEIVEGSSVTLTCSSDANPEATCTWYNNNNKSQNSLQERKDSYHFSSVRSEDSGLYHCKCVNEYGQNSSSLFIDVQYAPKLPSVSVSPSGQIVEGSSVNLTCSSDANPAASYTWYKENEDSPKASGHIFTITDVRLEHSGNYYCEAQNKRGRYNSTLQLMVLPEAWKSAVVGTIPVVLIVLIIFSVFLLIRKKKTSKQSSDPVARPDVTEQSPHNVLEERDEIHYASVNFARNQTDPVYSNIRPAGPRGHKEEENVEYATVKFNNSASSSRCQGAEEDPTALYSLVNKTKW